VKKILVLTVLSVLFLAGSAMAWSIDFRDTSYSGAQGETSFSHTGDGLTLDAFPGGAYLTWGSNDGIGVGGVAYEPDEIELDEILNITFDNSVLLSEIFLTDLFYEQRQEQWYEEIGAVQFMFDDGSLSGVFNFSQTDHTMLPDPASNGEYVIDVASLVGPGALIKKVGLAGLGYETVENIRQDHEFSVAGLNISDAIIPEPGTLLLLGIGLLGLFALARTRLKK